MKGMLLYFSGTGNTKFIANNIEKEFIKNGCDIVVHSIEEKLYIKNFSCDFLILGFPKYFEYIPQNFMEYIEDNLYKSDKEVKTMVFTTGRDKNKMHFSELEKYLLKKNYKVIVTKNFKMPNSFIISKKYKSIECEELECIYKNSLNEIRDSVANFLIENYGKQEIRNFKASIVKRLYKFRTKDLYKNSYKFSVSSNCDKCNLCVKVCPTRNIENIGGYIKFRDNCIMCCRCISSCPQNAILYKDKTYPQYKENIDLIVN